MLSSAATYTLATNVENLTLTGALGTENLNGTGNTLDNTIIGNDGNNAINGGVGADSMSGGLGNDVYTVDNVGDSVNEAFGAGTDTISTALDNFVLFANVENLTMTGTVAFTGTGNELDNVITGNTLANSLYGLDGNDTLNGGTGIDTLVGGNGDDTYVVDTTTDIIAEAAGVGTGNDTIRSSVTYTLDTANTANVENLTLTGTTVNGTGNALDNTLTGSAGNNVLNGGLGADNMIGLAGNDTYHVDNAGDNVTEAAAAGTDNVQSSISSYTLTDNVENLTLTADSGASTGIGNAGNNVIIGNANENTLNAGTAGTDSLQGGLASDTYIVDHAGVTIVESNVAGSGTDIVQSSAGTFTLATNVENLTLTGSGDINGTGNTGNNVLVGNDGSNVLSGAAGNDTITGGAGNDTITGGAGADTINVGNGNDIIVLSTLTDSGILATTVDTVNGFAAIAADAANSTTINLSAIDANTAVIGNDEFTWIGSGAFTAAGQLRYVVIGADTFIEGNVNTGLGADFSIQLSGIHNTLGQADFVL